MSHWWHECHGDKNMFTQNERKYFKQLFYSLMTYYKIFRGQYF